MSNECQEMMINLLNKDNLFVLGKGKSEAIAKEGSLKIKEITYIHAEGYSGSALKHGPFALLDENVPVILVAPKDEHYAKMNNAYEEIRSRNSPVLFITDDDECIYENKVVIPKNKHNKKTVLQVKTLIQPKALLNKNILHKQV